MASNVTAQIPSAVAVEAGAVLDEEVGWLGVPDRGGLLVHFRSGGPCIRSATRVHPPTASGRDRPASSTSTPTLSQPGSRTRSTGSQTASPSSDEQPLVAAPDACSCDPPCGHRGAILLAPFEVTVSTASSLVIDEPPTLRILLEAMTTLRADIAILHWRSEALPPFPSLRGSVMRGLPADHLEQPLEQPFSLGKMLALTPDARVDPEASPAWPTPTRRTARTSNVMALLQRVTGARAGSFPQSAPRYRPTTRSALSRRA